MRRFYVGTLAGDPEEVWDFGRLTSPTGAQLDPILFSQGQRYAGQVPLQVEITKAGATTDWGWTVSMIPIVLEPALSILRATCPMDFEALPLHIRDHMEASVVNVLTLRDCVDPRHVPMASEAAGRDLKTLYPVRVDIDAIGSAHIARASRALNAILISEELKEALEQAGIQGLSYLNTL